MGTVSVSTQPRRPGGAAGGAGGQFAQKTNSPPEGTLAESATGSFLYPPERFESAEQYLTFFAAAPISDQVLSNASHAYRKWRQKAILAHIHARHSAFVDDKDNIAYRMAKQHGKAGLDLAIERERPTWIAEAEAMYPITELPEAQSRSALRAHQIVLQRGMLAPEDQQAAMDYPIPHGSGFARAEDLVDRYHTYQWAEAALTESDYAQTEAMNRIAILLAEQQGITDYADWH